MSRDRKGAVHLILREPYPSVFSATSVSSNFAFAFVFLSCHRASVVNMVLGLQTTLPNRRPHQIP